MRVDSPSPPGPLSRSAGRGGARGNETLSTVVPPCVTPPLPAERERGPGGEGILPLRLAFAVPWPDRGKWIWQYLPPGFAGDLWLAAPDPDATGKRLPPYLAEWNALKKRGYRLDDCDVIFTWELRCALAVALMRKATRKRHAPLVAVGPILKGNVLKALPLVRWLMREADLIICFSSVECDQYGQLLNLPHERFRFVPTPWLSDEEETDRDDGFILALGQSNRDYGTLIRAARGTDLPVLIVAGNESSLGGEELPSNVTVRYNTGHDETNDLIAGASFHCIPLHNVGYSAGQTVLLRAMARGKAVVVSEIPGVTDYVKNDETALLVPPGDAESLRAALCRLRANKEACKRLGRQAARTVREEFGFPRFAERMAEIAREVVSTK